MVLLFPAVPRCCPVGSAGQQRMGEAGAGSGSDTPTEIRVLQVGSPPPDLPVQRGCEP